MIVLILILGVLGLGAAAFVVLPLWRAPAKAPRRLPLALAAGAAVLLVGIGTYAVLGQPELAVRTLSGPTNDDFPSLIASLATKMRERPGDVRGWTILGRGYLALGRTDQAVKALARAVDVARAQGQVPTDLLVSYGVALSVDGGQVTKDAEAAFREAHDSDPANPDARYYLGYALAERGDKEGALALWRGLLAVAPPDAPWRGALPAQLAAVGGAMPPNVRAMVQGLAARLAANPKDLDGWIMLIRSYAALGEPDKAKAALVQARTVFANDAGAVKTLADQARASGVE